jgi:hypothetical protein
LRNSDRGFRCDWNTMVIVVYMNFEMDAWHLISET